METDMNQDQANYALLIDRQTQQFIRHTQSWYPPDATELSVAEQRRIYDAMCREFHAGYPPGISSSDDDQLVASRHYRLASSNLRRELAQIVYFHGGGFVVGGLESHDDVCAEICKATGFDVTAIDYRLCPEHPHPAAFQDALAGVRKVWQAHQIPIIVCGDSAGGNLAAAVSHRLRADSICLAGQVLIYPGLGGDNRCGSYLTHASAPMLTSAEVAYYSAIRHGSPHAREDASSAPLQDTDFSQLPPTVIFSAECDPLADDGRHYRDKLQQAGCQAVWFNEAGLVHGYLRARHSVERAESSFHRITDAINALGEKRWPYSAQ